jgi:superfamily II DNA helicase RecQ
MVVVEKNEILAINLTKDVLNEALAKRIIAGAFEFLYLVSIGSLINKELGNDGIGEEMKLTKATFLHKQSPEAFLNNELFQEVYFNPIFQSQLSLVVVDEAHMIYLWGLVASSQSKSPNSHARSLERGVFRPSYGNLCAQLMATNRTPLLLMSATCRPIAIRKILQSLKISRKKVEFIQGELTCPEIWILKINMKHLLSSLGDLSDLYATCEQVPDFKIVPTLIYSTTRNLTKTILSVIDCACNPIKVKKNTLSTFAQRYHSVTGEYGVKKDVTGSFAQGTFPIISATMALGLGQNWKQVLCIMHMSRGDPASICQMLGRCGRDGQPGLAIMFVEPTRKNGKNSISELDANVKSPNNDDRMDALAITPVCI